jgi:hypothetical protein
MTTCLLALSLLAEKPKLSFIDYDKPMPVSINVRKCDAVDGGNFWDTSDKLATVDPETGAITLEKGVSWERLAKVFAWSNTQRDVCTGKKQQVLRGPDWGGRLRNERLGEVARNRDGHPRRRE